MCVCVVVIVVCVCVCVCVCVFVSRMADAIELNLSDLIWRIFLASVLMYLMCMRIIYFDPAYASICQPTSAHASIR